MKKITLLVAIFLVCAGGIFAKLKISAETGIFLTERKIAKEKKSPSTVGNNRIKTFELKGVEMVEGIVTINDDSAIEVLESNGVEIENVIGSIVTAKLPVDKIVELSELECVEKVSVSQIMKLHNDVAREKTNITKLHNGIDLSQAYKGKGVIVGVIDGGIDFNHINFKDANGASRVVRAKIKDNVYETASEIASLTTDDDEESHGTHTSGIAAGSYTANGYHGVAPEADLVLCGGELYDSFIINSCKYIFDYAKSVNKPAVINMSLGNNIGPHDGSDALSQALKNMSASGNIMVLSAGNEGTQNIYIKKRLSAASEEPQLRTILKSTLSEGSYGTVIDFWGATKEEFSLQFAVLDANNEVKFTSEIYTPSKSEYAFLLSNENSEEFAKYYTGSVTANGGLESDNNKYHISTIFEADRVMNGAQIAIYLYGKEGDVVEMWINSGANFTDNGLSGFVKGDDTSTINGIACGEGTISVGAYSSRSTYKSIDGNTHTLYNTVDDIAYFSSYGVDSNGISRPDIVAPGYTVVSSYNHYNTNKSVSNLAAETTVDDVTYYWGNMSGTSMSAPVVTGTIALWLEAKPTLTSDDIRNVFKATAIKDEFVTKGNPTQWGNGKIDAYAGLKYILTSGVNDVEVKQNTVMVYPNPTKGQFTVYMQGETKEAEMKIYTSNGVLVNSQKLQLNNGNAVVDLTDVLPAGLYIIDLKGETANYSSKLIIR